MLNEIATYEGERDYKSNNRQAIKVAIFFALFGLVPSMLAVVALHRSMESPQMLPAGASIPFIVFSVVLFYSSLDISRKAKIGFWRILANREMLHLKSGRKHYAIAWRDVISVDTAPKCAYIYGMRPATINFTIYNKKSGIQEVVRLPDFFMTPQDIMASEINGIKHSFTQIERQ